MTAPTVPEMKDGSMDEADRWDDGQAWLKARGCAPTQQATGEGEWSDVQAEKARLWVLDSPHRPGCQSTVSGALDGLPKPCSCGKALAQAALRPFHPLATHQAVSPPEGVGETWESMAAWGEATFGPASNARIAERANEEMVELLADPDDIEEAADVCIVLSKYPGIREAIDRKMAVNRARQWNLKGDGTGYHVKPDASQDHPHRNAADGGSSNEGLG